MKKLTVYCCYHKDSQLYTDPNIDPCLKWYYGPEDPLNQYLSEFSMFKWIWKTDTDSDYIATTHYRRRIYSCQFNEEFVNENSCQVLTILSYQKGDYGIQKFCSKLGSPWLWDDYKDYTIKKYGESNQYLKTDEMVAELHQFICQSCFILTRHHFMNMCDFIFGMLEYIDKKYELNNDPQKYKEWAYFTYFDNMIIRQEFDEETSSYFYMPANVKRTLSFLFEWLASIYIQTWIPNVHLLEWPINMGDVTKGPKISQ